MKRKTRRDEYISPNNLIVPLWAQPVPKESKIISIVSSIIFVICVVFILAYEKIESLSTTIEFLSFVFVIATPMSFFLSFTAPVEFFANKFLRKIKNEEAEKEMREREKNWKAEEEINETKARKIEPSELN